MLYEFAEVCVINEWITVMEHYLCWSTKNEVEKVRNLDENLVYLSSVSFEPMIRLRILCLTALLGLCWTVKAQNQTPENQFIDRGLELFDAGRWADARHEFVAAHQLLKSSNTEARQQVDFYLAACAVELGRDDAAAALLDFEKRYPASVYTNDVNFSLGSYYCSAGNMSLAKEYFLKTNYGALSASRRQQYNVRMGYAEFVEGDYVKAYDYFNRINSDSEYYDHALYYKSYIDYANGKMGRAKQGFAALSHSEAYQDLVPYYLLQIEFSEGNYRYVVERGEELAQKAGASERRSEIERVIAESWFRMEDYNKTIEHLQALVNAGGQPDREGCYLMGFSLYRSTRYAEAAEWLRKACGKKDALTQNASYHLADCYLREGNKQAAMQSFAMAADETLDREVAEDALFNYAKLQYELGGGAFNGAINVLKRYVEQYPHSKRGAEARSLLVAAYYNSRDYDAAYRAIKSMSSTDGELKAALQKIAYFRGLEAYSQGKYQEAQRYLAESASVGVSPKYVALNAFWMGEIAYHQHDYTVASVKYDAFLKRAPRGTKEYALAWYNLGYCGFSTDKLSRSEEAFEKFLKVYRHEDRYRGDAYNRLGDIRYAHRQYDEAIAWYRKAVQLGIEERHYARYKIAVAEGVLGHPDKKQRTLQQIVNDGAGHYVEDAAYELGRNYIAQEKYGEGAKVLEDFIQRYPTSSRRAQALADLGLAHLNLGNRDKSLKYYDMAVNAAPHSGEAKDAMQGIREIYVSQGDVDGYFDYAKQVGMESDLTQLSRDSLSFVAAQKIYLKEAGKTAAKSLRSYLSSYPKGYYISDALYFLSDCYLKMGDRHAAVEALTELSEHGNNRYMKSALEQLSKMTYEDGQYAAAARAYRLLYDATADEAERKEAMAGYVDATLLTNDSKAMAEMADEVRHAEQINPETRRKALFAYAEELRQGDQRLEAMTIYKSLAGEVKSVEGSASAYYMIEDLFLKKDLDKAEKAVFNYSERSPKAYWLARAFILLGDVYEQKGDAFQARATWQSVADGYSPADDGIVEEATQRIRNLK